jgi:hypothetical protein
MILPKKSSPLLDFKDVKPEGSGSFSPKFLNIAGWAIFFKSDAV